jgi:hypothetical protein
MEQKIEKVVGVLKVYEKKNLELRNTIERLEEELQGKIEAENAHAEERALIRSKVDNILARLEDIAGV